MWEWDLGFLYYFSWLTPLTPLTQPTYNHQPCTTTCPDTPTNLQASQSPPPHLTRVKPQQSRTIAHPSISLQRRLPTRPSGIVWLNFYPGEMGGLVGLVVWWCDY